MNSSLKEMPFTPKLLNIRGKLLDLSVPKIMGILNVTPDSFYSGSRNAASFELLKSAEKMLNEGAHILDVGGMSSRPGADELSVEEELKRTIPAIEDILKNFPEALISIDSWRAKVAREAILAGAGMINDISAGEDDPDMLPVCAELQVPFIAMHKAGTPKTMQNDPKYENVTFEIFQYFVHKVAQIKSFGINDIIIDPGFGFGKTTEHNYQLLRELSLFKSCGFPILAGVSRKSMICKVLKLKPEKALNGTTAVNTIALMNGASILRVHDVKEAGEAVLIYQNYERCFL